MKRRSWAALAALLLVFSLSLCVHGLPAGEGPEQDVPQRGPQEPQSSSHGLLRWEGASLLLTEPEAGCEAFLSVDPVEEIAGRNPQAEVYFRCFSGDEGLPCRAVLTLENPYLEGEGPAPLPEDCRLYSLAKDGSLLDVTSLFTYVAEDEDGNQIDGWRTKVWTLGSYVIADCDLEDEA